MTIRQNGSALVEALIAAAVVLVSLSAMYQALLDGAARVEASASRGVALLIARSQLAKVGSAIPATSGQVSGNEGDYHWVVDVQPLDSENSTSAPALVEATVRVGFRGRRASLITLHTLRPYDAP